MKQNKGGFSICVMGLSCILILAMAFIGVGITSGAELFKGFLVKYEHGEDVLCEPYIVKKDDWVYKVFRQNGEMFANDFREFTRIFKRLNPHLQNIERIRPNQKIIVPIKKIKIGTYPSPSSDDATITSITVSNLTDLLNFSARLHEDRQEDSVSKLISEIFGPYGTKSYDEGIQLLKSINSRSGDQNILNTNQQIEKPQVAVQKSAGSQPILKQIDETTKINSTSDKDFPIKSLKSELKTRLKSSKPAPEKNQIQKAELPNPLSNKRGRSKVPLQNTKSEVLNAKSDSTNLIEQSILIKAGIKSGFEVQAIAWSDIPAERIAVINGRVIHEGDAIDGAIVTQIGVDDIFLKMGGNLLRLNFKDGK